MGCATSKHDDSPAVALCRERCAFLDEAVRQRFAFAEAHMAYLHSLKEVGHSLDRFFNHDPDGSPPSPVLNLPTQRKGDPHSPEVTDSPPPQKIHHHLPSRSDSGSGSHLHFHSDDEDSSLSGSGSESFHHHSVSSPAHHHQHMPYGGYEHLNLNIPGVGGHMNVKYMKKQPPPSVVHTQRPMSPETMYMGESSSYYPHINYSNNHNSDPSYFNNGYSNYGAGGAYYPGSSPPEQYGGGYPSFPAVASSSKAPPPPPSPPSSSPWDFLNPFESYEKFYPPYTPSRDSREVREEEGIPDLEDEEDEVVKEVHGHQKLADSGRSSYSEPETSEEDADTELQHRARPSVGMESDPVEYEVHMVDKKVLDAEERLNDRSNAAGVKPRGLKGDSEVVREIQVQFERASESGSELAKFLEVGKLPYKRKHGGNHVSSKILHLPMVSSQPSKSKSSDSADPALLDMNQEIELRSKNLSSTLHKLHLWEKKLYEEVKVEEKMRIMYEQKSKKLKRLDEKGAEAHKIDATRASVRNLSTKIRIAIQVVDKISVKINNLRDEELWPQLHEFIQGLTRMWKSMLECHQSQCQAIGEAKRLDAIAVRKHFSDAHFEATRQLQHDLIKWTLSFSYWVTAQKGFVRALNNWLMKCLLYVPEETADGIVPFSPGRIGAPPVFVVCNQWWQSLDTVSEKEVVGSMRELASTIHHLWDEDKVQIRQRMLANKEERKVRSLDKEDQKIQKEIQALDKRMVLISADEHNGITPLAGHAIYRDETTKGGSLQASLRHVLEAMGRFTANSLKVYEELLLRISEDHLAREQEKVS